LLRGRGADVGAGAPGWLVRLCGATLAFGVGALLDALGVYSLIGLPKWIAWLMTLVVGAVLAPTALGGALWALGGALTLLLMLVMYTPITRPMVDRFIRSDAPSATPVDAILVLSGGITDDGRLTGQALDRLLSALAISQRRGIAQLALSVVEQANHTSEADQKALVSLALPGASVRFVRNVFSTYDEAVAFTALARTNGWRRVILVTSPMHSARACATLEKTGLSVECRPADGRDYSVRRMGSAQDRREMFKDVVYEVAAAMLYRVRGWL
jgi:uncharacterized SAM-binding protein YcdF (DUF218 family)